MPYISKWKRYYTLKTIWHVVERLDLQYGGPSNSVPHLCANLSDNDSKHIIIGGFFLRNNNFNIIKLKIPFLLKKSFSIKLGIVPFLYINAFLRYGKPDFIFFHNLWNGITMCGYIYCCLFKINYSVTPRGSLFEWSLAQGFFRKKVAWYLFQKRMLVNADFIHVTSEEEKVAVCSLVNVNCVISPNGIDDISNHKCKTFLPKIIKKFQSKRLLYIGRLHKKKNIESLILGFSKSSIKLDFTLDITGNISCENYYQYLTNLVSSLGLTNNVFFNEFKHGQEKQKSMDSSTLLVLPSHTENFGIVVLESLSSGTPVLSSLGTPWKSLNFYKAGYWVDCNINNNALTETFNKFSCINFEEYLLMCVNSTKLAHEYHWKNCVLPLKKIL